MKTNIESLQFESEEKWDINPMIMKDIELQHKLAEINAQGSKEVSTYKQKADIDINKEQTLKDKGLDKYAPTSSLSTKTPSIKEPEMLIGNKSYSYKELEQAIDNKNVKIVGDIILNNPNLWGGDSKPDVESITWDQDKQKYKFEDENGGINYLSPVEIKNELKLSTPRINSEAEFNALPSGAKYIASDGVEYTKP